MNTNYESISTACASCVATLTSYFNFITVCNLTEERIIEYGRLQANNSKEIVTLSNVLSFFTGYNTVTPNKMIVKKKEATEMFDNMEIKYEDVDVKDEHEEEILVEFSTFEDGKQVLTDSKNEPHLLLYRCKLCNEYKSKRRAFVQLHIEKTHKDVPLVNNMYKCRSCEYQTKFKSNMNRHAVIHKNKSTVKLFSCPVCDFETKHRSSLKQHIPIHSWTNQMKCEQCKRILQEGALKKIKNDEYNCKVCNLKINLKTTNVSDDKMYKCGKCEFRTDHKLGFSKHMLVHNDNRQVKTLKSVINKCKSCNFESNIIINPRQEIYNCENCRLKIEAAELMASTSNKKIMILKCDLCSFETEHRRSFTRHAALHKNASKIEIYQCKSCDFKTVSKGGFNKHNILHDKSGSEQKIYKCEACKYSTKYLQCINKHLGSHREISKPEMYSCAVCEFKTRYKSCIKTHHQMIHKEISEVDTFTCEVCQFQSRYRKHLKRHMVCHNKN